MADVITIPKKLIKGGELVIMPRKEYEMMLRIKQRLLWEEKDTDDAIRFFNKEQRDKKLKKAASFSAILGTRNK